MTRYSGYINKAGVEHAFVDFTRELDASVKRMEENEVTYIGYANGKFESTKERR